MFPVQRFGLCNSNSFYQWPILSLYFSVCSWVQRCCFPVSHIIVIQILFKYWEKHWKVNFRLEIMFW
jgi:hypothetical protein